MVEPYVRRVLPDEFGFFVLLSHVMYRMVEASDKGGSSGADRISNLPLVWWQWRICCFDL